MYFDGYIDILNSEIFEDYVVKFENIVKDDKILFPFRNISQNGGYEKVYAFIPKQRIFNIEENSVFRLE